MDLVPSPDSLGIPGPIPLVVTLLVITHAIHAVFMNYVLGGSWFLVWLSMGQGTPWKDAFYKRCLNVMPVAISMAITFGVAPLLFVQVLYGQFFYVANILMGWFWLAILALILVAFWTVYLFKARSSDGSTWWLKGHARVVVHLFIALCFTGVAGLFTTNAVLSQHPAIWPDAQAGFAPGVIWREIHLVVPRFLHNFVGSLVIAGLWVMWIAAARCQDSERIGGLTAGVRLAFFAVLAQSAIGLWYFLSLPSDIVRRTLSLESVMSFTLPLGMALALGLGFLLYRLIANPDQATLRWVASGHAAVLLLVMMSNNEVLRHELLREFFTYSDWLVEPQWGPITIFLVLFAAGLGVVGWLAHVAWGAHRQSAESEARTGESISPPEF